MRLFFAIELSEAARGHLARVQDKLRGEGKAISWTKPQNLHVTLKFLGDVEDGQIAPLCERVKEIATSGPITLRASRLLFFPPRGGARIVAADMEGNHQPLVHLYDALELACADHGLARERRKYRPHVTLARPRQFLRQPEQAELIERSKNFWPGPDLAVAEFVLMESRLGGSRGSQYLPVARFSINE